jgi:hypothetical protein
MNTVTCLRALGIFLALAIVAPATARTNPQADQPTTPVVQQNCPTSLYYKSCLGLMPPAYSQDSHAPVIQADPDAPRIGFLNPAGNMATGSWPQVLAAGTFDSDNRADVAVATARYFDAANDERLHLLTAGAGGHFSRTLSLVAGASPEAVVTTDFNLDGRHDVALALGVASNLAVYSQTTTLTGPLMLALSNPADALAVGDFSGDLRPDLAAA